MDKHQLRKKLEAGLALLPLNLNDAQCDQLVRYLFLLQKWNHVYNLTAIREIEQMLILHVFDSLSVVPYFQHFSTPFSILDVGSGGGLPGVVLSICLPQAQVTSIDIVQKKTAFQRQAKMELALENFDVVTGRVEKMHAQKQAFKFDFVISRAFAELSKFINDVRILVAKEGKILAMKAVVNLKEIDGVSVQKMAILPLFVPFLDAQRHLIEIQA